MEKKRMTKKDYFAVLAELVKGTENEVELTAFINREVELLSKKVNGKTKTQKENEVLVENIYEALVAVGHPVTVSELQGANEAIGTMSNQKVSALLKKLVDAGRIVKTSDKKKSYFSVNAE